MPTLDSNVNNQIFDLLRTRISSSDKNLLEAWELLPNPKAEYNESYLIASILINFYLKENKVNKAIKWGELIYQLDIGRIDTGEREFLNAKIAYELEKFDDAKRLFKVAFQKSDGRCFIDTDSKYFKFYIAG